MTEVESSLEEAQEKSTSLDKVNKRLGIILSEFKRVNLLLDVKKTLIEEANSLLYEAIYNYPHLAHSIEVKLGKRAYENSKRIEDQYDESHRLWYKYLVDNRISQRETDPYSLVTPLPYGFTTGTHGSGERAAMDASRREIYFELTNKRGTYQSTEPSLWVTVRTPLIMTHETMFLPEEIEQVSLSGRDDLSPYLGRDWDKVESRGNYITNYLNFRGFENRGVGQYTKRDPQPIILVPLNDHGLWTYDWQKSKLVKGFFVSYYRDNPQKKIMYEVTNQPLSSPYSESDIGTMVSKVLLRASQPNKRLLFIFNKQSAEFGTYSDNKILERLAQIPVAERRF